MKRDAGFTMPTEPSVSNENRELLCKEKTLCFLTKYDNMKTCKALI